MRVSVGRRRKSRRPLVAMSSRLGAFLCATGLVSFVSWSCGVDAPGAGSDPRLTEHFVVLSEVALDEGGGAVGSSARIRAGDEGELLVVEWKERRVRSFSTAGALRWSVGISSLREPQVAIRLDDTTVLVAGERGQARALLATDADQAPREERPLSLPGGIRKLDDMDVGPDSLVIYSTSPVLPSGAHAPALHVVQPLSGRLVRSFFEPEVPVAVDSIARIVGGVQSSVRADTIASVFAPLDTIFLHTLEGAALERIPLPTTTFRVVDRPRRPGESPGEWSAAFNFTSDVFWLATGDFVVQFIDLDGRVPRQHLLGVSRSGELLFQIDDSPRLHAVLPNGDFLFSLRGADAPSRLLVARRR